MTFTIEKFGEAEHGRLYTTENIYLIRKSPCAAITSWDPGSSNYWTIDHARNIIFHTLRCWEPRDGAIRYLMLFEGWAIIVVLDNHERIPPLRLPPELVPRLLEIQSTIQEIFTEHGFYGVAPPIHGSDIPTPIFF